MGEIAALNDPGQQIIRVLRLDSEDATAYRRLWLAILRNAARSDEELFRQLVGYPHDLPDLSSKRVPGSNDKPHGVAESAYELRRLGRLPEWY